MCIYEYISIIKEKRGYDMREQGGTWERSTEERKKGKYDNILIFKKF